MKTLDLMKNNINLLVYDFDGVMTDNRVLVDQSGNESVFVNRSDGYAVRKLSELGIKQIILSTEENSVVKVRGQKLKIETIHGVNDKKSTLIQYCQNNNYNFNNVMFIGNDLNDYEAMKIVGMRGCPKDATIEILKISDWVSSFNGGYGVISELYKNFWR